MDKQNLRFGVIGMGSIAPFHIRSIQELPNCELKAVVSSNPQRAQEAGDRYGVDAYTDFRPLVQRTDIDAVIICTASGYHLAPTLAAAAAGKHVITEKPLEVNLERADEMINACRKHGVKLACIFQNRFKPGYQKVKNAVQQGLLGKLVLGNAYIKWYRSDEYYSSRGWRGTHSGDGGAALINQSIHTIDLLQDVMGPIESVYGTIKTMTHDIEGEDIGTAILTFKNGAIGTIEGSTSIYPGYPERLEVHGEKGGIIMEAGEITSWKIHGEEEAPHQSSVSTGSGASDPTAIDYAFHKLQLEDIASAIRENREPSINGEEGRKSLEIIMSIYESARTGRRVVL